MNKTKDFGAPVNLNDAEYSDYLRQLESTYEESAEADEKFCQVINIQTMEIEFSLGVQRALGYDDNTSLQRFFQLVHPEYLESYLMWAVSAYQVAFENRDQIIPLRQSYRITLPLRHHNGEYYWYSQHATALRIDAEGHLICQLNTYYYEGKWSRYNLRPFEACLSQGNQHSVVWDRQLNSYLAATFLLDQFRNSEIELLNLYAQGHNTAAEIMEVRKGWSKHVIYEYNKNILQKAFRITQYEFKEAKDVALLLPGAGVYLEGQPV